MLCCQPMRRRADTNLLSLSTTLGVMLALACSARETPRQSASPGSHMRDDAAFGGQPSKPLAQARPSEASAENAGTQQAGAMAKKASTEPSPLVELPGGVFEIGSNTYTDYERPTHKVDLAPFSIEATEVTVVQYFRCVSTGACSPAASSTQPLNDSREQAERAAVLSRGCNGQSETDVNHPITCVDWNQAAAYCTWIGRRLPTEEEWEYAAREPDGRFWVWGKIDDPRFANTRDASLDIALGKEPSHGDTSDGFPFTAPVASFPRDVSNHGVSDLMGNVSEWTASAARPYVNVHGNPLRRIVRGNSWASPGIFVGGVGRFDIAVTWSSGDIGFRCAAGSNPPDTHTQLSGVAAKGQCETDAECSNGQSCWKYRCLPCRQVCKHRFEEALRQIAAEPNFCDGHDVSCPQTQAEVMAGMRTMARAGYELCIASQCGKRNN
jgi:formylglycine-generating enzyme required for sulfatase activity